MDCAYPLDPVLPESNFMSGKRRDDRVSATLPVRIFGMDSSGHPFSEQVRTRNISKRGALLTGVKTPLKAGEVIGLAHSDRKSRFRVAWVAAANSFEAGSVGIEDVSPAGSIWVVPVPKAEKEDKFMAPRTENRRQHPRFKTDIAAELRVPGGVPVWGKLSDISAGGCYVEMMIPFQVGMKLKLTLWIDQTKVFVQGFIISSHRGYGCGIKFTEMTKADRDVLDQFLERLKATAPPEDRRFSAAKAAQGSGSHD